jgi:hypothetical protein
MEQYSIANLAVKDTNAATLYIKLVVRIRIHPFMP